MYQFWIVNPGKANIITDEYDLTKHQKVVNFSTLAY